MKKSLFMVMVIIFVNIYLVSGYSSAKGLPRSFGSLGVLVETTNNDYQTISNAGSGFFVTSKDGVYFITAKHVLFSKDGKTLNGNKARLVTHAFSPPSKEQAINLDTK